MNNLQKKQKTLYTMSLNDIFLDKVKVFSNKSHYETYTLLRSFKTPQYDNIYVLRNKKAFNTAFFNINYDIVLCDKDGKVMKIFINKSEGYISNYFKESYFVYFMSVGSINFYKISALDIIRLQKIWM